MKSKRKAYVVLGMHRSNTSLVAGCLHQAGVDFGCHLIPVNENNPTGYWELEALNRIHDRILREFGLAWDSPGVLPEGWMDSEVVSRAREDLIELLEGEFEGSGDFGIKDPRLCRFVPLWRQIFEERGIIARWLFVIRHPDAVVSSLERRGDMPAARARALWASYNVNAVADLLPEEEGVVLRAEDFVDDPAECTLRALGGQWPDPLNGERIAENIRAFCRPDLQHFSPTKRAGALSDSPLVRLYRELCRGWCSIRESAVMLQVVLQSLESEFRETVSDRGRLASRAMAFERGRPPVLARFYPMDATGQFTQWDVRYAALAPLTWTEVEFECDSTDLKGRKFFRIDPANACGEVKLREFVVNCANGTSLPVSFDAVELEGPGRRLEGPGRRIGHSRDGMDLYLFGEEVHLLIPPPEGIADGWVSVRGRIRFEPRLPGIEEFLRRADEERTRERARAEKEVDRVQSELEARLEEIRSLAMQVELPPVRNAVAMCSRKELQDSQEKRDWYHQRIATDSLEEFLARFFAGDGRERKKAMRTLANAVGFAVALSSDRLRSLVGETVSGGWLDVAEYLRRHPDIAASGANPIEHYFLHGWREGRWISRKFDPAFYLASNPDVRASGQEPLLHFLLHGKDEGRSPTPGLSAEAASSLEESSVDHRPCICFFSGEPHTPGHIYRIDRLMELLPAAEFETRLFRPGEEALLADRIERAEWIWIWRAPMTESLQAVLEKAKGLGVRIHYDLDDLMIRPELADPKVIDGIRSMKLKVEDTADLYRRTQSAFLWADQASAPTRSLVGEMSRFYVPTIQIPNGFSSVDLVAARIARASRPRDGKIRIGYACGSRTHQRDFRAVLPGLCAVMRRHPETVFTTFPDAFLLDEFPELKEFEDRIEHRSMVPVTELIAEYARFDVNLAPVEVGNRFCEAKSELKFFEAALVGTPTIASPVRPFRDAIRSGENGFLAADPGEWEEHLEKLVADEGLRMRLAETACEESLWTFGPHRRSLLLRHALGGSESPTERALEWAGHLRLRSGGTAASPVSGEYEVVCRVENHPRSRVSVVMPVYNYAHYLPEALDSLARQSLEDLDLVIVDDVSSDNSVAVAEEWLRRHSDRFGSATLLRHKENRKLGVARNTGVRFSQTEFFFPLDPDNWLKAGCLEFCLRRLEESAASFVYPDLEVVGQNRVMISGIDWHPLRFVSGNYIDAMALIRKSVWSGVGGYIAETDLLGWEDFEFWCRVVDTGLHGERLPMKLAAYRIHDESMLKKITNREDFKRGILRRMEELHPWLDLSRE